MPKLPQSTYRFQPSGTTVFWMRVAAPKQLKLLDPKTTDYRRSLRTRDPKEADSRIQQTLPTIRKNWALRLQQLEAIHAADSVADLPPLYQPVPIALDSNLIAELISSRQQSWAYTDDHERRNGCSDDDINEQQAHAQNTISSFSQVVLKGPRAQSWISCAEEALEWADICGYVIDNSDPHLNSYVISFSKNEIRIQKKILNIINGEELELINGYVPPDIKSIPNQQNQNKNYKWEVAIDDYKNHQSKNISKKTLNTELNTIESLKVFLNKKDILQINSKDIYNFFQFKLEKENWSNDRVHRHGKNTLKKFFSSCVTQAPLDKNPMDSLQILPKISNEEEKLHKRPNKTLCDEQLSVIFNSDWYTKRNIFKGNLHKDNGARYWIPLILLFHGFRVTEACQLHQFNIKFHNKIPCFDTRITKEILNNNFYKKYNLELSSKTKSTQRLIPIHPGLLNLGFIEYIEENKNPFFLFPSSIPDDDAKYPKIGRSFEQAFLRFIKNKLCLGEGFGNHSFRHHLEDKIRKANRINNSWPAGISQQYMGRSFKDIDSNNTVFKSQGSASDYGDGYPPENILECIETMDFSQIKLPPNYKTWLKNMH